MQARSQPKLPVENRLQKMLFFRLPHLATMRLVNLAHVRSVNIRDATVVFQFLMGSSDTIELTYNTSAEAHAIFGQIQHALAAKDALK